jgi:hypothetical protein
VRATSAKLLVGVLLTALLLVVILFILDLDGLGPALGPGRFAVFGPLGAFAVIAVRYSSYAAGSDWFGRGDNTWVDPNDLTEVRVEGGSLRLRDSAHRRLRVPLQVLREDPRLFTALRQGVHRSLGEHSVQIDERARGVFISPAAVSVAGSSRPGDHILGDHILGEHMPGERLLSERDDGSSARRS